MASDWKDRLGVVFSTNPDFAYNTAEEAEAVTLDPSKQNLKIWLDRLKGGRVATVVRGFVGSSDDLAELGKEMEISRETILLIQHMILSHHEIPEYGSPKPPPFPEAQMLHILDLMDARMFAMHEALLTTPRGNFSDRVRALDGRKLYHPDLTE